MMTPAEKFVTMLETNIGSYMDSLKDSSGQYTSNPDASEFQSIFNDTLKDFLETYLQVDIVWVGFTNTVPPTPDPIVADFGYSVSFSSMQVMPTVGATVATAESLFDMNLSLAFKTGMVQIPTASQFSVAPLMLNPAGQIVTAFPTIANGTPPKDNEESREMTKKAYKQVFDSLTLAFFNPLPVAGTHTPTYTGTMSMANLYFKPITDTSTTHPEKLYTVTPKHEIKFLARDSKAPSEMVDAFTEQYGFKTESEAETEAQSATKTPYTYKECTTEGRTTSIPYDMYMSDYASDPDFDPHKPVDQPVDVTRYYITSISATIAAPKLYVLRTLTSEGYNVTENSTCKVQIVFQKVDDTENWDSYYKIKAVKLDNTTLSGDSELKYETDAITANCDLTVYLETK